MNLIILDQLPQMGEDIFMGLCGRLTLLQSQ